MSLPAAAAEPLTLGSLFTDHAVLQRDTSIPVWGKAEPGRQVVVQFAGQEKRATTDKDGRWTLKLDPIGASADGQTLTVKTDPEGETLTRGDVLVGEVWVCSGQSNMAWNVASSNYGQATIAGAGDAQLRLFHAGSHATDAPQESIGGQWVLDAPGSVPGFSAVAYFFGQDLRRDLKVPVGLIASSVGGTVAEAWTPQADLEMNPALAGMLVGQAAQVANYPKLLAAYKKRESDLLAKYEDELAKAKAAGTREPGKPQPPADPGQNNNRPTGLYNGSIAPLVPYAIRGAIWYQGESNSGRAKQYETLFPAMIGAWRKVWGQGDFPFLFVQIAPHNNMLPEIRDAQRLTTQTTPNTAMAVITDFGDAVDIHPRDKQPVGLRLALAARALAYKEPIEYSGPTLDGVTIAGNRAILTFEHLGGGLVAKDGVLKGFTIAGADGKFEPAKATIEGDTVVVSSDAVAAPVQVRYGWANVPDVNLFEQGRHARLAVSERTGLRARARLRVAVQWQGSDRLALRCRTVRWQDRVERRALHGPRRTDCGESGQRAGSIANRPRAGARLSSEVAISGRGQRRQRYLLARAAVAMPRLPRGWALQGTEELQAPGLE